MKRATLTFPVRNYMILPDRAVHSTETMTHDQKASQRITKLDSKCGDMIAITQLSEYISSRIGHFDKFVAENFISRE